MEKQGRGKPRCWQSRRIKASAALKRRCKCVVTCAKIERIAGWWGDEVPIAAKQSIPLGEPRWEEKRGGEGKEERKWKKEEEKRTRKRKT